jgi:arsenate reductase
MKFFGRSGKIEEEQEDKTVLFVCVENSGRSQMAEAFFREYAPKGYSAFSAGTKPSSEVNPLAIEVMREYAIDISKQRPNLITEDLIISADIRVNMGCLDRDSCPTLFIHNPIEWGIEDPKGKPIEKVREIRDNIEQRVRQLAANLVKDNPKINN